MEKEFFSKNIFFDEICDPKYIFFMNKFIFHLFYRSIKKLKS